MSAWTFWDFVEDSGRVPFSEWRAGLPMGAQAFIDGRILSMAGLVRWQEKWISRYQGAPKLFELRIPFMKVQYRPLGCYGPNRSFVLLAGATERDGKLEPISAVNVADRRRRIYEATHGNVRRHRFD